MLLKTIKQLDDNKEGRQGYGQLTHCGRTGFVNSLERYLLVQLQLIFRKSIASTNKAGKNWVCGSWMYLPKTAPQIFHSVSGNVKIKHLKPAFLCPSGMSCEVTARECRLQTF